MSNMNITDPLVLRNDVVLMPVSELSSETRAKFESDDGDYTISRRHGRMPSQVIDGETASLLTLFREPRTIVDAVIENSRALEKDPEIWLDEILPHLGTFLRHRVLVPAGSEDEKEMRQLIENGAKVGEWDVLRCVNLIEDSEIYRVRRDGVDGALKIARNAIAKEGTWFGNEEYILQYLDGGVAPRLLDSGYHEERPYLVTDWCPGAEPGVAASQCRHDRVALLELCTTVVRAYAELHDRRVVHSDVHPRNILIEGLSKARLIDFGLSRVDGEARAMMQRGGMYYFFEPEFLLASREGRMLASSFAGEQYAVSALLYLILTGQHYLEFRYDREEMQRQVETEPPLAFEARGIPPWPEVQEILFRGLAKNPADRWPSMRALADALAAAHAKAAEEALATPLSPAALAFVEEELAAFTRGGAVFADGYPEAPKASINYGAAGAAVGILSIATVRSDPKLLALAEVWRTRAVQFQDREEGWYNPDMELQEKTLGRVTPYHTPAGLHAATALLAHARGDVFTQRNAVLAFMDASSLPCEQLDLTLGRSGTLLAAALLLDRAGELPPDDRAKLVAYGNTTMREVWEALDALPPIAEGAPDQYTGIAHGWSGYLYAAIRWCMAADVPLPVNARTRLAELASLRIPRGRGAYWPRQTGGNHHDMMAGWCNGAAGHIFLWTSAHSLLGDEEYLRLAEASAWNAWEEPLYTADLCCGSAGRAYGLLNLYKHTGAREWLGRAKHLANHAATHARNEPQRSHALWKGELGVAVLIAEIAAPESAAMPLFE